MSDDNELSALRDNISRKGNNAYYYAHSKKIDGPVWDGREEPRLLSTTSVTGPQKEHITTLDTFSWMDDDKVIKIILEHEGVGSVPDEDISLSNNHDSFHFKFTKDGKKYGLEVAPLYHAIESATYRKKADKFVISLKKQDESSTWSQLKKTS